MAEAWEVVNADRATRKLTLYREGEGLATMTCYSDDLFDALDLMHWKERHGLLRDDREGPERT